jgi:peroxiredoxin Q/BCP
VGHQPRSHAAFRAKYGLPFTLLSDEDHAVAEAYGAWGEKMNYGKTYMGIIRSSFLVGPDGRIAKVWPKVRAEGHAEQVLAALREARGA